MEALAPCSNLGLESRLHGNSLWNRRLTDCAVELRKKQSARSQEGSNPLTKPQLLLRALTYRSIYRKLATIATTIKFMGCILLVVAVAFPRVILVLMYLFTTMLQHAYHGILVPLLG